jgi:hypothetical protein
MKSIIILIAGLALFLTVSNRQEPIRFSGTFILTSIDTVGPYYVLNITGKNSYSHKTRDTITVLSLISPNVTNVFNHTSKSLRLGMSYFFNLESMDTVQGSKKKDDLIGVNLRGLYIDNKLLIKSGKFPYKSKNIYKLSYCSYK